MEEDHARFLISAKGVVCKDNQVILARNSRGEWDLPGGKLLIGESIEDALKRELQEELGIELSAYRLISANPHHYHSTIMVLVYGCTVLEFESMTISPEHSELELFQLADLPIELIPQPYVAPITSWMESGYITCG